MEERIKAYQIPTYLEAYDLDYFYSDRLITNFYDFFLTDFKFVMPEIFLIVTSFLILLLILFCVTSPRFKFLNLTKFTGYLIILICFFVSILLINNLQIIYSVISFNVNYVTNIVVTFNKLLISIFAILYIFSSLNYLNNNNIKTFEYFILLLFTIMGMFFLLSSYNFIMLYLSIEFQSFILCILAAYYKNSSYASEAAIKYFILAGFSTGCLLFGISLIYGFTGSLDFERILKLFIVLQQKRLAVTISIKVGFIFILSSILFKLAVAPFHMWTPDVYEGIPTPIVYFFSTIGKIAILNVLIFLCFKLFIHLFYIWQYILLIGALLSLIIAVFSAIPQKKIKRFLAFSSISHMGFILLGISTGDIQGIYYSFFYLIIYIINMINIWSILLTLKKNKNNYIQYLTELRHIPKNNKILAYIFSISIFSLAGIPPLLGFFSKFFILTVLVKSKYFIILFLIIFLTVISAFYYLKLIKIMFFDKTFNPIVPIEPMAYQQALIISLTFLIIIFFIFVPKFLLILLKKILIIY